MNKKWKLYDRRAIIGIAPVLSIVIVVIIALLMMRPEPLTLQGEVEVTQVRISGKLPGRVVAFCVGEGDSVSKGDTVVHIHSSLFEAQLLSAQALYAAAEAENDLVDAGTRYEIVQSSYQVLLQTQAALSVASKTYNRMQSLYEKGVVSEQRRDEAQAAFQTTQAAAEVARLQYEMARNGARREQKNATEAMARAARSGVDEVEAVLEDAYLTAPCNGTISDIYPEVGELVTPGAPIMSIILPENMWVSFNVREELLQLFPLHRVLNVVVPALGNKVIEVEVFHIKDMGVYAVWRATKVSGQYDAKTFKIKARPIEPVEGLLPGMSVLLKELEMYNE